MGRYAQIMYKCTNGPSNPCGTRLCGLYMHVQTMYKCTNAVFETRGWLGGLGADMSGLDGGTDGVFSLRIE